MFVIRVIVIVMIVVCYSVCIMILVVLAVRVIHMLLSLRIKRDSTSILFAAAVYDG